MLFKWKAIKYDQCWTSLTEFILEALEELLICRLTLTQFYSNIEKDKFREIRRTRGGMIFSNKNKTQF